MAKKQTDITTIRFNPKRERNCDEVSLIGSGKAAYVWIGHGGRHVCNFSGTKSLRKLAAAILKKIPKV